MTMLAQHDIRANSDASKTTTGRPAAHLEIRYRAEAASYIAAMIAELRQMSGKAGFEKLVGVLDMAYYEAYTLMDAKAEATQQPDEKTSPALEPTPL